MAVRIVLPLMLLLAAVCERAIAEGASSFIGGAASPVTTQSRKLGELGHPDITESSGLARSNRTPGTFWTHNDSGDEARVFAFDGTGKHLGVCRLRGAGAIDWEDMASFERHGKPWLLLADVGDNSRRRKRCTLYLCEEPTPEASEADCMVIHFGYEDGPQDCEAVGVDAQQGTVLLMSKVTSGPAGLYQLPLPEQKPDRDLTARRVCEVSIPFVTSMDISHDGSQAIVMTYADAFRFERQPTESWREVFSRSPVHVPLPLRRQGEAICYGSSCSRLYLTSERLPSPLWEVLVSPR